MHFMQMQRDYMIMMNVQHVDVSVCTYLIENGHQREWSYLKNGGSSQ